MVRNTSREPSKYLRYWRKVRGYVANPIYPALLAAYVPVWLLSNNRGLFEAADAVRPILLTVAAALALHALLRLFFRDSHSAAFVAAVGIAGFFSFGYLRETLPLTSPGFGALAIAGTACLGATLIAFRTRLIGPATSKILNGFMAAMLLLPVLKIVSLPFGTVGPVQAAPSMVDLPPATDDGPNIIHIVVDGYSSADVLRELYGFDNSSFIESLRRMGFAVPNHVTTAYSQTLLSMNAIFSLDYVHERVSALSATRTDEELRLALNEDMQESPLLGTLDTLGYQLISVEGLYRGVHLDNVDHVISETSEQIGISYYEKELLRLTPIHRIMERLALNDATYTRVRFALGKRDFRHYEPPFFVYNHIVAPHPPFNIAANGQPRATAFPGMGDGSNRPKIEPSWYEQYRSGYVEKLRYTNMALLEKIRYFLSNVPDPKIIILHSDHGGGMFLDKHAKSRTCLKERMSAFLAVYSSDHDVVKEFPDRINLVNLYRILLSKAFGADAPLLPAHSYYSPWDAPSAFEEVSQADLDSYGPACSAQNNLIATHR